MRETVGSSRILAIRQHSKPVKDVCRLGEVTGFKCLFQLKGTFLKSKSGAVIFLDPLFKIFFKHLN